MPHSEKLSSLKNYLWPISRHERGLVFHMLGFMLLVWISVVPLLGIRDGVLLMGPNSGPEVLGYMKIAGTLPAGFIFIYVYTWLYRRFSQEKTIYILLTFFSALYLLFALVVFPSAPDISFSPSIIKEIMDGYPKIKWLFPLIGNWPLTIFFILNDLWIVFAITILFWQTADRFILSEEAKRFFPLFVIFGGLASILAEGIFDCIYSYSSYIQDEDDQWKFLIKSVLILNVTAALLSLGMYYKLRRYIQKIYPERGLIPPQDLRKPVLQSLAYITKSPYLVTICITLFAAFAIDELLAIIWKS